MIRRLNSNILSRTPAPCPILAAALDTAGSSDSAIVVIKSVNPEYQTYQRMAGVVQTPFRGCTAGLPRRKGY
jgi:hypothetical protein